MAYFHLTSLLLRLGLAGVFFYAAVAATLTPDNWIGYLPGFVASSAYGYTALHAFSAVQVVIALWLLSGKKPVWSGSVSALTMVAIVIQNITILDIVFRDVAIFFMAASLVTMHLGSKKGSEPVPASSSQTTEGNQT